MIYGVSPFAQKKEVDEYCFKQCKKILVGSINICGGSFFPCKEENCTHEDKYSPVFGDVDGEDVCVRKLKEIKRGMPDEKGTARIS